jgi:hypothetical protein
MKSITVTSDDPDFGAIIEFLKQRRVELGGHSQAPEKASPERLSASATESMLAQAGVQRLLGRVGTGSKRFLTAVVNHCQEGGTQVFTMRDIADRMGVSEKHVRANQRNVMKSAGAQSVTLWEKQWDFGRRHQVFTISQYHLEALQMLL